MSVVLTPEMCRAFLPHIDGAVAAVRQGSVKSLGDLLRAIAANPDPMDWSCWVSRLCPSVHTTALVGLSERALMDPQDAKVFAQLVAVVRRLTP